MFYPNRLRSNFPEMTQVSLILRDMDSVPRGHFFYVRRHLFTMQSESDISGVQARYSFALNAYYDTLSGRTVTELLDQILPGRVSDQIPEYLDDCVLVNGNYPSIHFRIMERDATTSLQVHRGTIMVQMTIWNH
jgi:hypothetical protein